jgi:hypothetical protein
MHRTFKIIGVTPADGPQVIDMSGHTRVLRKQVQIVSASSAAGSVDIAVRTPGADSHMVVETVNVTTGPLVVPIEYYCDSMRFTPASSTAAKTFDISVFCLQG